jgi:hypothetical protein
MTYRRLRVGRLPFTFCTVQWPNFFSLLAILLLAVNYFAPFTDLDFSWQIRTGEQIWRTGELKPADSFSYTISGQPVPEFEWLYEVILWNVWSNFGFGGLKLLKAILIATPLLLVGMRLHKQRVRWPGIALAVLFAIAVLSPAWNLRPLACSTIGLLLVSGWLHDHCTGGRPVDWRLVVVMLFWSNLHPGVIMGQALLCGALLWEWLNRWLRLNPPLDAASCRRLTLVGSLGMAVTFLSPHPLERLLYPFQAQLNHPVQQCFLEMQPLYRFLVEPPFSAWLVYPLAALVGLTVWLRFRQYRLWELGLLATLALLANAAVRSLQDSLLVMLALGAPHLAVLSRRLWHRRREWRVQGATSPATLRMVALIQRAALSVRRTLRAPVFRFQGLPLAMAGLFLAFISLIPALGRDMPRRDAAEWPVAALDWMEQHNVHGNCFGCPDYGSYVGWRLRERGRSYVDTRGFFFPPELVEDSLYLPQLGPRWEERLERVLSYKTDYFLLECTGPRGRLWHFLEPHIDQPLYGDGQCVLLSAGQVREALHKTDPRLALATER